MSYLKFIATTTFGLEATVKREIQKLNFDNISVSDGMVCFTGDESSIPKANIHLRSSDRILLVIGQFKAFSFDELFEKTKALNWSDWIPKDGNFIITGKSIKSQLYSVPDCQSIVEKAIVENLKKKYNINWFEKSGALYKIQVAILKDVVTLTIDTTGASLHKRGYRDSAVIAPLKETLAAALIELSFWKKDRVFLDPTCGSGTIPIEAAMIAKNIAPGISRKFVSEEWLNIPKQYWKETRSKAYSDILVDFTPEIYGSDIDEKAIEIAKYNAAKVGVDDCIHFEVKPLNKIKLENDYGVCVCNPPYAERMGILKDVESLYKDMGKIFRNNKTWSFYTITSHEEFEKLYGKKADKKRKLFNGNVKIDYYQYYGIKPPKNSN